MTELMVHRARVPDTETCWALLTRVAASGQLRRAARLQELLFYMGRRSLKEGCVHLHEQEIGTKVFGRPDSYDTTIDNIVRTNVSDLRKRIEAYFSSEGSHEALIMEIPRGSYIPVFRYRPVGPEPAAETSSETQAASAESTAGVSEAARVAANNQWMPAALAAAGLLIVALAIGCIFFWSQYRAQRRSFYAWQDKPTVAALWSHFLSANPDTDIVLSDTGIGMAETLSKKSFSLNDYLSHGYVSQLQADDLSPEMQAAVNRILSWNLGSSDEFRLALRLLSLDPLGRNIHLYNARNYTPDLIKRDNVILIGARKTNPWDELFDGRMNFVTEFDKPRVINRAPAAGEQPVYFETDSDGYCVVGYMPNPEHSGLVLLIEGTNAEATEAAGDFLLSEDQLSNFKKMLHVKELPFFQVLLKVSAVRGTPLAASIAAYRVFPNHR